MNTHYNLFTTQVMIVRKEKRCTYLTNGQQFSMFCSLIDRRNNNLFQALIQ